PAVSTPAVEERRAMRSPKRQQTFSPTPRVGHARSAEARATAGPSAGEAERPTLSPRRREVAELLVYSGLSYKQIAARLNRSEGTIRSHAEEIYRQYKVHSRFEL